MCHHQKYPFPKEGHTEISRGRRARYQKAKYEAELDFPDREGGPNQNTFPEKGQGYFLEQHIRCPIYFLCVIVPSSTITCKSIEGQ